MLFKQYFLFDYVPDAAKSTTGGHILFLSGLFDDCNIQKYEKEAKNISRESCWAYYCGSW